MLPEIVTTIPGPRSRALAEKLSRFEAREVTWLAEDFPVFWERAEGVNVWDVDGNRYLDFTSAFAVTGLGHSAEPLRSAGNPSSETFTCHGRRASGGRQGGALRAVESDNF